MVEDSRADELNSEIERETSYNREEQATVVSRAQPYFTNEQKEAFDRIISSIIQRRGQLFFLDAPGGTGKIFLLNMILAHVRQNNEIILAVATSGIASTLLSGGRSAHSAFRLPLSYFGTENLVCNIKRVSAKANMLNQCKAII